MSVSLRETAPRASEAGFNLVEVMLAMALLGSVLLSIFGMFAYGTRQTDRARSHTLALAVARDIVEEMTGWPFGQTWEVLGMDGTATQDVVDSRNAGYAQKWQPRLDEALNDSRAEILIESVDPTTPPALQDAEALRVTVSVFWDEMGVDRRIHLCSVRM
jgi:prepilin-type N-terminal cleavage/methylation domain-containing protein